jgi:tetratricopeptide (TPR) repeat protein
MYFLDRCGYLEAAFSGVPNYRERLFRALGSNDHTHRLAYAKGLMKDLWEVELGLGCYPFADVLSEFEFGRQFYSGYRDHVLHQLRVYLLGLYLFFGCKKIKKMVFGKKMSIPFHKQTKLKTFLLHWKIAALGHDHGYVFETLDGEHNYWIQSKVLPIFNTAIGFPLSGLSDSVRNNNFSETNNDIQDNLINLLRLRAISHNKELKLYEILEIVPPRVQTINDIINFRGRNLFESLREVSKLCNLSNQNNNGIESYYAFASKHAPSEHRSPHRDHGITSALFLIYQSHYNEYIGKKLKIGLETQKLKDINLSDESAKFITEMSDVFITCGRVVNEAAKAVAIHNIDPPLWIGNNAKMLIAENEHQLTMQDYKVPVSQLPIAFLLKLVDVLQDWDRPLFVPISVGELPNYQTEQDMSIVMDNDRIYVSFPNKLNMSFDPFVRLKNELYASFDSSLVDDLIKEVKWDSLAECRLTIEAEKIEHKKVDDPTLTNVKLKELIQIGKKTDEYEFLATINTNNEGDLLNLTKDIAAIANTAGGYIVVGIDGKSMHPVGVNNSTYLPDNRSVSDIVNMFYNTPIQLNSKKIKILFTSEVGKREYRYFHLIHVQGSRALVSFCKEGKMPGGKSLFEKDDIYIRKNAKSIKSDRDFIKQRYKQAQIEQDNIMMQSIMNLHLTDVIPLDDARNVLPGNLPKPDFVKLIGRETKIKEILDKLFNPKIFSLTIDGIGGSGKSALALQIAHSIKNHKISNETGKFKKNNDFDAVVWVTAKTCELKAEGVVTRFGSALTLDILLDNIADAINAPEFKELYYEEKRASILEWLEVFKCLIVIDNLETISDRDKVDIIEFLENEIPAPSKIIYTTRSQYQSGHSLRVEELSHEDAIKMAKDLAVENGNYKLAENKELLNTIITRTGRIPLGIKWVLSRICMGYTQPDTIVNLQDDMELLQFCFEETFNKLGMQEKNILYAIAVCEFVPNIDNIEFITCLRKNDILKGIERLILFSLVRQTGDKITILPLTKDYARFELEKDINKSNGFKEKIKELFTIDETVGEYLPVVQKMALKLYREALYEESNGNGQMALEKLSKAYELSKEYYILKALAAQNEKMGNYDIASSLFIKYIENNESDFEIIIKLAFSFKTKQDHKSAIKYFNMATNIRPENYDIWHHKGLEERLLMYKYGKNRSLGIIYCEAALKSFNKAVRLDTENIKEKHLNSINYYLIAKCYEWKNDINSAINACINGIKENPKNYQLTTFAEQIGIDTRSIKAR